MAIDRRQLVLGAGAAALAGGCGALGRSRPSGFSSIGVCTSVERAGLVADAGGEHVEEGVQRFLVPARSEADFEQRLAVARAAPLPVIACNGFLPGSLRSVGPDADHDGILAYSEVAFRRARRAGVRTIVFGSSGSRRLDGCPFEVAFEQFVELLKRMGPLASRHGVTVAIEPLQRSEVDFVNTIEDGCQLLARVQDPGVRLTADLFHMARNGETPADLAPAAPYLHHGHLAEVEGRTAPGVAGDDFRGWFRALGAAGYRGPMSIEGRWEASQLGPAFARIRATVEAAQA